MKNKYHKLFKNKKPVFGMLHLKGDTSEEKFNRALEEIELLVEGGVDAVIVENYFGDYIDMERVLKHLWENTENIMYGVNALHDDQKGFDLANKYGASFVQFDSVCGHLSVEDDIKFGEWIQKQRQTCKAAILGGVRFKYQPYLSGRTLEEDLTIGKSRCDAIVITGEGTGLNTPINKIEEFRKIVGDDFPLVIGAGLTPKNCNEQLKCTNGTIVGSYFKDTFKDTGDVSIAHVKTLISAIK